MWYGDGEFDFSKEENIKRAEDALEQYLTAIVNGEDLIVESKSFEDSKKMITALFGVLSTGCDKVVMGQTTKPGAKETEYARRWAQNVREFIQAGVESCKNGLNPRVYISW